MAESSERGRPAGRRPTRSRVAGRRLVVGSAGVAVLLATSILLAPTIAHAEVGNKAAKAHADKGLREYNLEHFAKAIGEFEEAYALDPAPVFLFNIAQAHRKSGANERALSFYRRYLEAAPDAPNRSEVEARIRDLERLLAKRTEKDVAPSTTAAAGATNSTTPTVPVLAAQKPPEKQLDGLTLVAEGPAHSRTNAKLRLAAWVTGGAAIAAAGTSMFFLLSANQKATDFGNGCGLSPAGVPIKDVGKQSTLKDPDCAGLHSDWDTARRWTYIGYAVTGALAVSSAALFLLSHRKSHGPIARASVDCSVGLGVLACRGVF